MVFQNVSLEPSASAKCQTYPMDDFILDELSSRLWNMASNRYRGLYSISGPSARVSFRTGKDCSYQGLQSFAGPAHLQAVDPDRRERLSSLALTQLQAGSSLLLFRKAVVLLFPDALLYQERYL